jgi:hypothetical protein
MIKLIKQEVEKYVKVIDDWEPNFPGDTVRVKLMNIVDKKYNFVRICVHGAYEFGLEMDFWGTLEENDKKFIEWKEEIFDKLIEPCSKKYFKLLGLYMI